MSSNFLEAPLDAFAFVAAKLSSGRDVRILLIRIGTSPRDTLSTVRRLMMLCVWRKSSKMNWMFSRMALEIIGSKALGHRRTMARFSHAAVSPMAYWSSSTRSKRRRYRSITRLFAKRSLSVVLMISSQGTATMMMSQNGKPHRPVFDRSARRERGVERESRRRQLAASNRRKSAS